MSSLSIVTAACGSNDITKRWFEETIANCKTNPEVVLLTNGSTKEENDELNDYLEHGKVPVVWGIEEHPLGSTKAFNEAVSLSTGDIIAMIHNDLMVLDEGWDVKVLAWFEMHPETGVAGFHGSRALGHFDIYKIPYQLVQLARGENFSNLVDAESHGHRWKHPIEVATLDGMSLICQRSNFDEWGGLNETYIHHMYDHDLCLTARQSGFKNYMLPVSAHHLSGQTANMPRYNDHFEDKGRDVGIHQQAHLDFYERWRGTLPVRVIG